MKIVFFGSSHFAVPSLQALIKSKHEVACVVTQPDKQRGRHLQLSGTDIKSIALNAKLKIFQPENINAKESVQFLKSIDADIFVIVAYGQILSQEVLDIPKMMPINIHASLLPRYRGAAPINWAIINGEKKSGITIIYVTPKLDSGPVILQEEVKIEDKDTAVSLEEKLRINYSFIIWGFIYLFFQVSKKRMLSKSGFLPFFLFMPNSKPTGSKASTSIFSGSFRILRTSLSSNAPTQHEAKPRFVISSKKF